MKVAQYEVLGNDAKSDVRPDRDDRKRSVLCYAAGLTSASSYRSSRPGRIVLKNATQHFVLGYFRSVLPGRFFIAAPQPYLDGRCLRETEHVFEAIFSTRELSKAIVEIAKFS